MFIITLFIMYALVTLFITIVLSFISHISACRSLSFYYFAGYLMFIRTFFVLYASLVTLLITIVSNSINWLRKPRTRENHIHLQLIVIIFSYLISFIISYYCISFKLIVAYYYHFH